MKTKLTMLSVLLAAMVAWACGDEPEAGDEPECGQNTVEQDGQCVPEPDECDEGEVRDDELGRCVRAAHDYCGEGTIHDEQTARCVGTELDCGDETDQENGECVVEEGPTCGEDTVAEDGVCHPVEEVCGEGTELSEYECRVGDEVCGEGTSFDVTVQLCVPDQQLECGDGTVLDETDNGPECIPKAAMYEEMAENPDLDMTGETDPGEIELADEGERFVFTGRIDGPEIVDGQPVQDEDVFELEADEGQWLEITVYSLGLPEPGFEFVGTGDEGMYRLSDRGDGIEANREILVRGDGDYELTVSNLVQMLDEAQPAGGDDWDYVGYVETMETPEATAFDLLADTATGDIRELSDNYYKIDDEDIGAVAMIFDEIPTDASAELQVWTDETTHESTIELGEESFSFEPPRDGFYLVFDRNHAFGPSVDYTASAATGEPAAAGETISMQMDLGTGDYVGLFQYNLAGEPLAARIMEDGDVLESTNSLEVSNAEDGQLGLYRYANEAKTVTLELENNSGEDLGFLSFEPVDGTTEVVDGIDGTRVESEYDETLPRGHRHYYKLEIDYDDDLAVRVEDADAESELTIWDEDGSVFAEGRNAALFEAEPGDYLLVVEATGTIGDGFVLAAEAAELFTVTESSQPAATIPENDPDGVTDSLVIDSCPYIDEVEVSVDISHQWRSDLIVEVEAPDGQTATLHDRDGGSTEDINATWPNPDNAGVQPGHELAEGEDLYDLIGSNGGGTWTIEVSDHEVAVFDEGTLESWSVTLTCEG